MDVKDIIIAASIAKGAGGGSGGGVTKEYVDTQVGAVSERVGDVEDIIPSAATPQNPLATAADVSETAIISTSTASPVTDSADGMVQKLTVYGRSEVVDGAIKSIGDAGWGVVDLGTLTWTLYDTTATRSTFYCSISGCTTISDPTITPDFVSSALNVIAYNDNWTSNTITQGTNGAVIVNVDPSIITAQTLATALSGVLLYYPLADASQADPLLGITSKNGAGQGTAATITTGLPLRSVSDTVKDKLICTAESKQVETMCGKVRLADLAWSSPLAGGFAVKLADSPSGIIALICSKYPYDNSVSFSWSNFNTYDNKTLYRSTGQSIYIKDTDYTSVSDFVASLDDAELVYELATPATTPLTTAEISAFRGLRTYANTTNITISDEPEFELDYLKNSDNGKVVADVQRDLQEQIDEVKNAAVMGSTIVVVTNEPTLYGRPVTVTADSTTLTGTFSNTGECTFRNLAVYGAVQAESTNSGGVSAKGSTNITYFGTYVVGISFNVATINLTCSDVSFAGVPVSIYHNGEVVTETSLRLNSHGVLEGTAYVENTGRYTAVAVSAGNTVFTSVAVISLKQTYTGTLAASYLPNSDIEHIICEAYGDNFVDGALTWGNGQTPVAFNLNGGSVTPTLQEDNSVYIPVATNNIFASVDLGAPATPFTAYVVMKLRNPGTDSRIIGAMNSRSGGQGILLYSSTIQISSWANETSTGISSAQYVVCAIQFVGTNLGRGFVRGYGYAEKPSATAGQYVTLARPDINPDTTNASPGDGYFKYVAVVNEAESIQTVQANIEHLNSVFLGE